MGGVVSAGSSNDELVDNLKGADYIRSPHVERVFRAVDRADYYTDEKKNQAYTDMAWKKGNLHLSAPCIYAQVMEGLQLSPGHSFLNLGSGTGYLSTMAGLIIGSNGINHGVELHADVISYAQERLEYFKKYSPAVDAFNFCDPHFVQGNCLCLSCENQLYDRVYCGASCPDTHENFIRGLIKVGGILVMPLNDQLLKITRTGENSYESFPLLPVSFSSLIMPDPKQPSPPVILPTVSIPSLQETCRIHIRGILLALIEEEHPDLKTADNRPVPIPGTRISRPRISNFKQMYSHYITFDDFDEDEDDDDDDDDNDDASNEPPNTFTPLTSSRRRTAYQIAAIFERAGSIVTGRRKEHSNSHMSDDELPELSEENVAAPEIAVKTQTSEDSSNNDKSTSNAERVSNSSADSSPIRLLRSLLIPSPSEPIPVAVTTNSKKTSEKREKCDSGVCEDIENGKGSSSSSAGLSTGSMDIEESCTDSDYSDHSDSNISPKKSHMASLESSDSWHLLDPDSIAEEDECENGAKIPSPKVPSAPEMYSKYMKNKIIQLPLPLPLKMYVNFNRSL